MPLYLICSLPLKSDRYTALCIAIYTRLHCKQDLFHQTDTRECSFVIFLLTIELSDNLLSQC